MKQNSDQDILESILSKELITDSDEIVSTVVNLNPSSEFDKILHLVKHSKFDKKSIAYIDVDVHEVFKRIRDNNGPNLGDVFSFLGEQFIKRYTPEIKKLIDKNNKYL